MILKWFSHSFSQKNQNALSSEITDVTCALFQMHFLFWSFSVSFLLSYPLPGLLALPHLCCCATLSLPKVYLLKSMKLPPENLKRIPLPLLPSDPLNLMKTAWVRSLWDSKEWKYQNLTLYDRDRSLKV